MKCIECSLKSYWTFIASFTCGFPFNFFHETKKNPDTTLQLTVHLQSKKYSKKKPDSILQYGLFLTHKHVHVRNKGALFPQEGSAVLSVRQPGACSWSEAAAQSQATLSWLYWPPMHPPSLQHHHYPGDKLPIVHSLLLNDSFLASDKLHCPSKQIWRHTAGLFYSQGSHETSDSFA